MKIFKAIFFLTILSAIVTTSSSAALSVVVNKSNTSELSEAQVKNIFMGKLGQFTDGTEAVPVLFEAGKGARTAFDDTVLQRNTSQVDAVWSKLIFTGRRSPPLQAKDASEVLKEISSNPKAIGYLESGDVTDSVRVLATF
ncbi:MULTISPECIES: phosphate ABC transporter substrate-binding protein [unclassified Pseudoalteromonas]|jgi:ABC-type phosphate transport system substrate-binding protein|uniref:phosphate ABC transporter substrate-binding protein n=1 Tax=unclassified Pseudoalteromonas TaxID=194690 RepID=UPI00110A7509|nr:MULTISPECIES: phosphate ABC transporter substrate-binding protein [unclassified Pseudoalteromonas]MBB1386383.1 phosphate ABC transporter substrate-binding protein [Pseudoalteromonas sp. SG45-5]MBB1394289.1 phosphate ABC transporter substrate-binding protein [Pseudoalteromonas sp. SG44-4]MBB1448538.1 phosphate ABC transporter substrate-binding protein [Pseudoalteromonas sp. SG41-6]TMO10971.1 phosphate ABC transporter substrate-binding protein [Pseudoalteromonas sp. S558]